MPMQAPDLDDRRFADIVAEAKSLIPRYTREWTDHNDSDPGITLIQLFAWMTEMLLYRLNQVPERNYIKFLQLLGIELKPAQPARAELTFTLARTDVDAVMVPKGTQVAAGGGPEPLVFETDEALIAVGARLKAVQSFDGLAYAVGTTKNKAVGQWFYPFGVFAREGSALLLGFDSPVVFTTQQVNLAVYVFSEGDRTAQTHCDLEIDQMPVPATLAWEYWDSRHWEPMSVDKDESRAFSRSGHVYVRGPGDKIKKDRIGDAPEPLYWIRCRLVRSTYESAPRLDMVLTNTVRATQAQTVRDEVVGGSDGRPGQTFRLANAPVVVRERAPQVAGADGATVTVTSLHLEVDEGHGFAAWQEVDDFYASAPDAPHYVLNRTTGEISFGDGRHGRIPVANLSNPNSNIVAREYRYGGGKSGNVGAGAIKELQTFVDGIDSVTNLRAADGGAEEETVSDAKLRAPRELKSKGRAVTAQDFEDLAVATPGVRVRRAKALPLVHPKFPDAQIPGVVTVIIVPGSEAPNPMPSEATIRIVCAHLNLHRLLTSEVYVVAPRYHRVKIEADVVARSDADLAEVKNKLDENLKNFFHPLKGGDLGKGWEFGHDIFYSDVYRIILQSPGVDRISNNQLVIWLDKDRYDFCRDVALEAGALLYSTEHAIQVSYSMRE
jgi:predicted phage baseplate assembly protein